MLKYFVVRSPLNEHRPDQDFRYFTYQVLSFSWDPEHENYIQLDKVFKSRVAAVKYAKKYAEMYGGVFYGVFCHDNFPVRSV